MKIIWKDGYDRENIADRLIAENVDEINGQKIVEELRFRVKNDESQWYRLVPDDYCLSRGMEDLV